MPESAQRPLGIAITVFAMVLFIIALVSDVGAGLIGTGGATAAIVLTLAIIIGLVYMAARSLPTPKA